MFRALLCPSSGARDYDVDYHLDRFGLGLLQAAGFSLQPGHYSSLTATNFQPTANKDRKDQCGNQHHSRELLMMGIVVPETCLVFIFQLTLYILCFHDPQGMIVAIHCLVHWVPLSSEQVHSHYTPMYRRYIYHRNSCVISAPLNLRIVFPSKFFVVHCVNHKIPSRNLES